MLIFAKNLVQGMAQPFAVTPVGKRDASRKVLAVQVVRQNFDHRLVERLALLQSLFHALPVGDAVLETLVQVRQFGALLRRTALVLLACQLAGELDAFALDDLLLALCPPGHVHSDQYDPQSQHAQQGDDGDRLLDIARRAAPRVLAPYRL